MELYNDCMVYTHGNRKEEEDCKYTDRTLMVHPKRRFEIDYVQ
jgi:hypothetical protein